MAQQPDDFGGKIWEHPWSTGEMRKNAEEWNLAADAGLLKHLQQFSQTVLSHTHATEKALDSLLESLNTTNTNISNVTNDFLCLANTQFVESRVYDDDVESPQETQSTVEKPTEGDVMTKVRTALSFGVALLDTMFEPLDRNTVGGDGDFSVRARCLEPKNPYSSRPLPHLIGSPAFMADDNVGLIDSGKETNEPVTKVPAVDEVSMYSDESILTPSVKRHLLDDDSSNTSFGLGDETPVQRKKPCADVASVNGAENDVVREGGSFAAQLAEKLAGMVPAEVKIPSQNDKSSAMSCDEEPVKQVRPTKHKGDMFGAPQSDNEEDDALFSNRSGLFSGGRGLFDDLEDNDNSSWDETVKGKSKKLSVEPPAAQKSSATTDLFSSGLMDEDGDDLFAIPRKHTNVPEPDLKPRPLSVGDVISQSVKKNTFASQVHQQGDFNHIPSDHDAVKTNPKAALSPGATERKVPIEGKSVFGAAGIHIPKGALRRRPSSSSSQGSDDSRSAPVAESPNRSRKRGGGNGGGGLFHPTSADEDDLFASVNLTRNTSVSNVKSNTEALFTPSTGDHLQNDLFASSRTPPKMDSDANSSSPRSLEGDLFQSNLLSKSIKSLPNNSSVPPTPTGSNIFTRGNEDTKNERKKSNPTGPRSRGLFDDDRCSDDDQSLFAPAPSNKPAQSEQTASKTDFLSTLPPPLPSKSEEKVKKNVSLFDDSDSGDDEFLFSSASSAGSRRSQASTDIFNSSTSGTIEKKPLKKNLFDNEDSLFGSSQLDAPDVDIFSGVDPKKSVEAPPNLTGNAPKVPPIAPKPRIQPTAATTQPTNPPAGTTASAVNPEPRSLLFDDDDDDDDLFSVKTKQHSQPKKEVGQVASTDDDDLFSKDQPTVSAIVMSDKEDLFNVEISQPFAPEREIITNNEPLHTPEKMALPGSPDSSDLFIVPRKNVSEEISITMPTESTTDHLLGGDEAHLAKDGLFSGKSVVSSDKVTPTVPDDHIPEDELFEVNENLVNTKRVVIDEAIKDSYNLFGCNDDAAAFASTIKPTLTISDEESPPEHFDSTVIAPHDPPGLGRTHSSDLWKNSGSHVIATENIGEKKLSGSEVTSKSKPVPPRTLDIRNTTDPKLGTPFDDEDDDDSDDLFKPSVTKLSSALSGSLERNRLFGPPMVTSSSPENEGVFGISQKNTGSVSVSDSYSTPCAEDQPSVTSLAKPTVGSVSTDSGILPTSEKPALTAKPEKAPKPTPAPRKSSLPLESEVVRPTSVEPASGVEDSLGTPAIPSRPSEPLPKPSPFPVSPMPSRDAATGSAEISERTSEGVPSKVKTPVAGLHLNINPLALLPGAQPPKKKTPGEEPVGFDQPIENSTTLHSVQKGRVKPGSKRRPPSRRARQATARHNQDPNHPDVDANPNTLSSPSTVLSPSTDEDDLFGVPQDLPPDAGRWPFNVGSVPIISPGEQYPSTDGSSQTTSAGAAAVVDDPLLKLRGEASSETDTDADAAAAPEDHSSLFAFVKKKPKEPQPESLFSTTPTLPTKADRPPEPKSDVTEDGDNDDDLFKPSGKIGSMRKTVVSTSAPKTWKLSDDDDDDLFTTGSKAGLKGSSKAKENAMEGNRGPVEVADETVPTKTGEDYSEEEADALFSQPVTKLPVKTITTNPFDDDDDDLFSSAVYKTAQPPRPYQANVSTQKKTETSPETKTGLFDDPLSGPKI